MLRLFVMRHAKSSWAVPGAQDFDRELNDRGKSDLLRVAKELTARSLVPEKILCSAAVRTRQTLEGIQDALQPEPEIAYLDRLYSGGVDDYLAEIRAVTGCSSLMTIGHNPMSGSLASSLAGDGDLKAMQKIAYKFPTSTIAIIDFDTDEWSQVAKGQGKLLSCIFPSKLPA